MDPELLKAVILGVIQGLTEFLPVSSSGHLEIGKVLLGAQEATMLMTVVLHAATALSTIVVFRADILSILQGLVRFSWNDDWSFAVKIVISMIPAVIVGLTMDDFLESLFSGNMLLVGSMLLLTGVLLLLAERAKQSEKKVGFGQALLIGLAQAFAILPGISRSGATISTSVLLGIDRAEAARFSFLMVIPLILGKMCKDILSDEFATSSSQPLILLVGFIAAFITGFFACKWMIAIVKKCQLRWFSIYCFTVGVIAIASTMLI
ncbi:MAG: undecaprenyl-diphosphate phosphatase [Planctomycetota bacterium]|nr:undecaprenyl-diphosphate phosphatase [Planctomycetota bacterium]